MKVVIDIDEITYKLLCYSLQNGVLNIWEEIIAKGTPLPKHSRLIDTHDLKMCIIARMINIGAKNNISTKDLDDVINNEVKTILKANEE